MSSFTGSIVNDTNKYRFVCETNTTVHLDWPDIGWDQAWRLAVLFTATSGDGRSYIYGVPS